MFLYDPRIISLFQYLQDMEIVCKYSDGGQRIVVMLIELPELSAEQRDVM